jgi:hypothetical protein
MASQPHETRVGGNGDQVKQAFARRDFQPSHGFVRLAQPGIDDCNVGGLAGKS